MFQFFSFCANSSILVTSSSQLATTLQTFLIKTGGSIFKLPKIETNTLITKPNQQEKIEIREKDVNVLNLYSGQTFIAIIQHPSVAGSGKISPYSKLLFTCQKINAAVNIKRMYDILFLFIIDSSLSSMSTLIHLYRVYKENSTVSRAHVLRFKWKMTFYYVLLLLAIFITNNEVYHEPDFLFYTLILALFMKGIVFHCHLQLRL